MKTTIINHIPVITGVIIRLEGVVLSLLLLLGVVGLKRPGLVMTR